VLARMEARFRRCARMGFDAVEPDNIDLHINDTGLPVGKEEVITYVRQLSRAAHRLGLQIAQKNAGDLTGALMPLTDFAMAENCLSDGWCPLLAPHTQAGQVILAAEYTYPSRKICAEAGQQGLSLIFKRRSLTRWRALCP
ncbi:MAG: endo alpha-1,4 polygalactosaminidase, partial [Rhodobacterales bacterium]